jgi:hypothetical protein
VSDSVTDFIYGCELPWRHRDMVSDFVMNGEVGFVSTYTSHEDIFWFGIGYASNSNGFNDAPEPPSAELMSEVDSAYEELSDELKEALNGRPRNLVHSYAA